MFYIFNTLLISRKVNARKHSWCVILIVYLSMLLFIFVIKNLSHDSRYQIFQYIVSILFNLFCDIVFLCIGTYNFLNLQKFKCFEHLLYKVSEVFGDILGYVRK